MCNDSRLAENSFLRTTMPLSSEVLTARKRAKEEDALKKAHMKLNKERAKQERARKRLQEEASRREALENVLQTGPIEDIIRWRDAASHRVSKGDSLKKDYIRELNAIEKRTQSDIRWIRKLNNVLNARTFGQQKHTKGERVRVLISKEIVRV